MAEGEGVGVKYQCKLINGAWRRISKFSFSLQTTFMVFKNNAYMCRWIWLWWGRHLKLTCVVFIIVAAAIGYNKRYKVWTQLYKRAKASSLALFSIPKQYKQKLLALWTARCSRAWSPSTKIMDGDYQIR